jgi:hypothetical protein
MEPYGNAQKKVMILENHLVYIVGFRNRLVCISLRFLK